MSVIDSASKYVLWLHVSKKIGGLDENLIIGLNALRMKLSKQENLFYPNIIMFDLILLNSMTYLIRTICLF